jgi:hypothetical protein
MSIFNWHGRWFNKVLKGLDKKQYMWLTRNWMDKQWEKLHNDKLEEQCDTLEEVIKKQRTLPPQAKASGILEETL